MCYPWTRAAPGPWRSCKRTSDCGGLAEAEGGTGGDGVCYKHPDRRSVRQVTHYSTVELSVITILYK